MVRINGELLSVSGQTIAQYLSNTAYKSKFIAVERNGEIVPKTLYEVTILEDEDCIEIVNFVGGG